MMQKLQNSKGYAELLEFLLTLPGFFSASTRVPTTNLIHTVYFGGDSSEGFSHSPSALLKEND